MLADACQAQLDDDIPAYPCSCYIFDLLSDILRRPDDSSTMPTTSFEPFYPVPSYLHHLSMLSMSFIEALPYAESVRVLLLSWVSGRGGACCCVLP